MPVLNDKPLLTPQEITTAIQQAENEKGFTPGIYELEYKKGGPKQSIVFKAADQKAAESLAEKYCKAFNLRYIIVTPFIHDLEVLMDFKKKKNQDPV